MAETNTPDIPEKEDPGNTWSYLIICWEGSETGGSGPTGDARPDLAGEIRTLQGGDWGFSRRSVHDRTDVAVHQPPTLAAPMRRSNGAPMVSCVMPTYNRRRFFQQAIRYFLRQDYPDRELIVVDDGTDAISDLIPNDPSILYLRLPNKHSIGAKRNLACGLARGAIIVCWDDDDWYAPNRIS